MSETAVAALAADISSNLLGRRPIVASGLGVFQSPDALSVYLSVQPDDQLTALQALLYERAVELGLDISAHSVPALWKPHVTLCTLRPDTPPPSLITGTLALLPTELDFSRPSFVTDVSVPVRTRASAPTTDRLTIGVNLADSQMITYARRELSVALSEAGATGVEWDDPATWSLPLVTVDDVDYGAARSLLADLSFDDTVRASTYSSGFLAGDGALYLRLKPTESLDKLRALAEVALREAGHAPVVEADYRVRLCQTTLGADLWAEHPDSGYPVYANNLMLKMGERRLFAWTLRSASVDQVRELANWRAKVVKRGASAPFEPITLAGAQLVDQVRACLDHGIGPDVVFQAARAALEGNPRVLNNLTPVPGEYDAYWKRFDALQTDLGAGWTQMMADTWEGVRKAIRTRTGVSRFDVRPLLAAQQVRLKDLWMGTDDAPGPLVQIILAGMASADEAVARDKAANPTVSRAQTVNLSVDWQLLNQQARSFGYGYSYNLIRGIDDHTADLVQNAVADWLDAGQPLRTLTQSMQAIFQSRERAQLIAQTESVRVFNEGAFARWQNVGVTRAVWQTVRDAMVCPVCGRLQGQEAEIAVGWFVPGAGAAITTSAHPGCRCFRRPIVETRAEQAAHAATADAGWANVAPVKPDFVTPEAPTGSGQTPATGYGSDIRVKLQGDRSLAEVTKKLFNRSLTDSELLDSFGIGNIDALRADNASLKVTVGNTSITVNAHSGDYGIDMEREIFRRPSDHTIEVHNALFLTPKTGQGKGLGTRMLLDEATALQKLGVARITTLAARGPTMNGYYTWPRLGYDGALPREYLYRQMPPEVKATLNPDGPMLSELMSTPEGRAWWKANGSSIDLTFDLTPGSKSMAILQGYAKERGLLDQGGEKRSLADPPDKEVAQDATAAPIAVDGSSLAGYENPPDLTEEDERILDKVWAKVHPPKTAPTPKASK